MLYSLILKTASVIIVYVTLDSMPGPKYLIFDKTLCTDRKAAIFSISNLRIEVVLVCVCGHTFTEYKVLFLD